MNSDYSKGLTQFFEEEFTKLGGKVLAKEAYTQTDPDFKGQLTKIRNLNADVLYIPGYYGQVGIIAKQARELDMNMPLLGGDGWDSPEIWKLGGEALKNSYHLEPLFGGKSRARDPEICKSLQGKIQC